MYYNIVLNSIKFFKGPERDPFFAIKRASQEKV